MSIISGVRGLSLLILFLFASVRSLYRGADTSLARPTSRCILFDGKNVSFEAILDI
jgi:hypothetical protein